MFSDEELAYSQSQPLARLGTVDSTGQPNVDAVTFEFDGVRFLIGGHKLENSRKYKSIAAGNGKVSLIVDDLRSQEPWQPRGIKLHGTAAAVEREGRFGPGHYIVVTPTLSWSWGLAGVSFQDGKFTPRRTVWPAP